MRLYNKCSQYPGKYKSEDWQSEAGISICKEEPRGNIRDDKDSGKR